MRSVRWIAATTHRWRRQWAAWRRLLARLTRRPAAAPEMTQSMPSLSRFRHAGRHTSCQATGRGKRWPYGTFDFSDDC